MTFDEAIEVARAIYHEHAHVTVEAVGQFVMDADRTPSTPWMVSVKPRESKWPFMLRSLSDLDQLKRYRLPVPGATAGVRKNNAPAPEPMLFEC